MTSFLLRTFVVVVLLLSTVSVAGAQTDFPGNNGGGTDLPGNTGVGLVNPLRGGDLISFLNNILSFITTRIAPIVIILMLVYIGFLFATTSVNPENKQKAREYLMWTIIGALILLGAQAISIGIQETVRALSTGT